MCKSASWQRPLRWVVATLLCAYFVLYFMPPPPQQAQPKRSSGRGRGRAAPGAASAASAAAVLLPPPPPPQLPAATASGLGPATVPAAVPAAPAPSGAAAAPCAPGVYPGRLPQCASQLHAVIPSRATHNNAIRRATIRYNMAKSLDASRYSLSYYFLLSRVPLPPAPPADAPREAHEAAAFAAAMTAAVEAENATHHDMFYVPLDRTKAYPETIYERDMVKKVWHEMVGLLEAVNASAAQASTWWAKFDDDAIVLWDRFFPALAGAMPSKELVWCAQGSGEFAQAGGYSGMYCNGPYLLSTDVVLKIAADPEQGMTDTLEKHADKEWHYNDDYVIIRRNFDNGRIKAFGADQRWHSDDKGRYSTCACKPWTLTSDSLVVHHPHPDLVMAWHENRTRFALLGQPYRPYGYNVCAPDGKDDPSCNWVQQCRGAPPAPEDCIIKA